ncbi:hypothetical protein ACGAPV_003134 [Morganella morganii]
MLEFNLDPEKNKINNIIDNYGFFLKSANVLDIVKLYCDDAEIIPHNLPSLSGIDKINDFYEKTFSEIRVHGDLFITSIDVFENFACVRCEEPAEIEVLSKGDYVKSYFREIFILKKDKTSWRIYKYMFSENPSQISIT